MKQSESELSEREQRLLQDIRIGKVREVERDVRDRSALEQLQRRGLVFTAKGRPRVPRTSAELSRMLLRGAIGMVQREEVHLSAQGTRWVIAAERKERD